MARKRIYTDEERRQRKKDASKKYYKENREKCIEYKKRWVKEHKEKQIEYNRKYYKKRIEGQQKSLKFYKNITCKIIKEHHEEMKHDPDHLTTEFIQVVLGVKC